jgi:hypothetical protein
MDAIVGGVILGIGLAVTVSLASRALGMQAEGRQQVVASWLVDELLAMVLVEGPVAFPNLHPRSGRFDPPFDQFEYDVAIEDIGLGKPFRVTAVVSWPRAGDFRSVSAQTYIAEPLGDPIQERAPLEPIDRIERYYGSDEDE